jgi:hypothetical protein
MKNWLKRMFGRRKSSKQKTPMTVEERRRARALMLGACSGRPAPENGVVTFEHINHDAEEKA